MMNVGIKGSCLVDLPQFFFSGVFSWFLMSCYLFDLLESHILITADSEFLKVFFTMESRW